MTRSIRMRMFLFALSFQSRFGLQVQWGFQKPAHNEEKHIEGALENIRRSALPTMEKKQVTLQVLLIANGCKDNTIAKATQWAKGHQVEVRAGHALESPPASDKTMVLDIVDIPACNKMSAVLYSETIFEKWRHFPSGFAYMDADTRMTPEVVAVLLKTAWHKTKSGSYWKRSVLCAEAIGYGYFGTVEGIDDAFK